MITTHMMTGLNVLTGSLAVLVLLGMAVTPVPASAALFGFVDTSGYLRTVEATSWQTAIVTASNIHMHSGVMLMNSAARLDLVGERI